MSAFIPLKDDKIALVNENFTIHDEKSNLSVLFNPAEVSWKPTRQDEPAIGVEPLLHFLSGTGCLLGEVKQKLSRSVDVAFVRTAPIVQHLFAGMSEQAAPHQNRTQAPMLHYGPQTSVTEVTVYSSEKGKGELRRAATCFLQILDPRWVSTLECFRRYESFTDDAGWSSWKPAREGRCRCNLTCLLFRTERRFGLDLNVGNAIVSITSKENAVTFPERMQADKMRGFVPELEERDLCEIAVNDSTFIVVNANVAMLHISTASLQGTLDVMFMTICFCSLGGMGIASEHETFLDVNYLRHKGNICRLDTEEIPELPEQFRKMIQVTPDEEIEKPVPPSVLHFNEIKGRTARGLKRRTKFEVGWYVEMCLIKNDGGLAPVALGIIAHLPETDPIKKVILHEKEYQNERFVGVCFLELLDAQYSEVKYEVGLCDRTGHEIKNIGEFVVGEEYLWDLCYLSPAQHFRKVESDAKIIMRNALSRFRDRWKAKHGNEYTPEYQKPPNWRPWDMEDRSIVPIEL